MREDNMMEPVSKTAFEPSDLVEYGAACERTQGSGGPSTQQDGAVYNS